MHTDMWEPDCACSSGSLQVSSGLRNRAPLRELQLLDPVAFSRIGDGYVIAHSPYSAKGSLLIGENVLQGFQQGQDNLKRFPPQLIEILVDHGIIGPHRTRLLPVSSDTLQVWLQITNACNLRCNYCYVKKTNDHMSYETGSRAIEAVFRSAIKHRFSLVKLKYAGGEPTLRFSTLREIHTVAVKQSTEANVAMEASLLTNGTLLSPSMVDEIKEMGLRVVISIDGLGMYHDAQRPMANGEGSFNRIQQNLIILQEKSVVPFVSITLTDQNLEGLPAFVCWLLKQSISFNLNFERTVAPTDTRFMNRSAGIANALVDLFETIEADLPRASLLAGLLDRANLRAAHYQTCGAGSNYVVVGHDGRISRCQMDVHSTIGQVCDDDPVARIRSDKTGIYGRSIDQRADCRSCTWRYWCTGGCPLQASLWGMNPDAKSPNCESLMAMFPRMLRLEGLRLLKFGVPEVFVGIE